MVEEHVRFAPMADREATGEAEGLVSAVCLSLRFQSFAR
jgi:hypothetical protein